MGTGGGGGGDGKGIGGGGDGKGWNRDKRDGIMTGGDRWEGGERTGGDKKGGEFGTGGDGKERGGEVTPGNGEVGVGEDKRRGGNWKEGKRR